MVSACAGFRPASQGAAINYEPETAVLLSKFSDYAYIKDENELKEILAKESPPFSLLRKITETETGYDAQAFIAYNDSKIIIAVRGSEFPFVTMDWRNNVKFFQYTNKEVKQYCPGSGIHGGFFQSALRIKEIKNLESGSYIYNEIIKLHAEGGRKLYFTGHSLGGAIANVLAFFTAYETPLEISGVYTYGEPKGGNITYQECHDERLLDKTFRFINNRDVVARIRGPNDYVHLGNLAYFDRKGQVTDINTYSKWGVTADIVTLRFVRDHFLETYKKLVIKNINVNPYEKSLFNKSTQPNAEAVDN